MKKLFLPLILSASLAAHTVTATGYTSTRSQTDATPCIGATGLNLCRLHARGVRIVAVSRDLLRRYPYGSHILLHGRRYLVADTMHARWRNRIDLYFGHDHRAMYRWGKRRVQIRRVP